MLVGRMELLPPSQETEIAAAVRAYRLDQEAASGRRDEEPPPVPGILAELGRFAEPPLVRVRELSKDPLDAATASFLIARIREIN